MKKFQVTVTRVDTYIIELDEQIINDAWRADFEKHFWKVPDLKDVAEHLATNQARFGQKDGFMEGFGYVKRDGALPYSFKDIDSKGNPLPDSARRKAAAGINIIIDDEDNDIEAEVITIPEINSKSADEKTT